MKLGTVGHVISLLSACDWIQLPEFYGVTWGPYVTCTRSSTGTARYISIVGISVSVVG